MRDEIISEFKKYIWTVDYKIIQVSEKFYEITFPNCIIEYYHNEMYQSIECFIKFKGKSYDLVSAMKFNERKTGQIYDNHSEMHVSKYIEQYTKTLNSELLNFILHDFSWCDRVTKSIG